MKKIKDKIGKIVDCFFIGYSFLASKRIIAILEICLFISLIQVSTGYQEVLESQEEKMYQEEVPHLIHYYQVKNEGEVGDYQPAIEELIQCYKKQEEPSLKVREYMDSIYSFYHSNTQYFSFLYQDLYTGFTVSYNENAPIFTASTIKAPAMIYLYEKASEGQINLEEKLTYTSNFYHGGSGVLQYQPVNTEYSIEKLIYYAIHDSDNIAYAMLMNRFKRENILSYWSNLGTKQIYTLNTIWGVTSAHDAAIYMNELYRFYQNNPTYGKKLMEYFKNAEWKLITDKKGEFNTANKGGWSGSAIHDVAIVFDKNPYLLVIMSNTGEGNYHELFSKTSLIIGQMHEAYWQEKETSCKEITQH